MILHLDQVQTTALAVIVLFIGSFMNRFFKFLSRNNIPEPVVGGILFAALTSILYTQLDFELAYDTSLQNPLMLTFFSTVGLGASFKLLSRSGAKGLLFFLLAVGCLILQNAIGISLALLTHTNAFLGLIGGSITLSGGHGTGATWAQTFSQTENLQGAMEVAMACATFGLVFGGLIGGPLARRLLKRHHLQGPSSECKMPGPENCITFDTEQEERVTPMKMLEIMLILSICVTGGGVLYDFLMSHQIKVPTFVCSLMLGIVFVNFFESTGIYRLNQECVSLCGSIALSIFLTMALMSLRLWELINLAGPMLLILSVQIIFMGLYCTFLTFPVMGKDYDAAIIAGGHCGLGLGATPTAVANMEALTANHGASPQAFFIVPTFGAFFVDIVNALVISTYLALPLFKL